MQGVTLNASHTLDFQLVRAALDRRAAAVDALLLRLTCVPRILRAQNRRLGRVLPPDRVQDLAQDVLMVIWRKLPTFEGRSALETWAYRICRFELANAIRRHRHESVAVGEYGDALEVVVDGEDTSQGSEVTAVCQALDELGPPSADVIRLKHFQQLTFPEIGERLKISANTAKSHYYRGLLRLRELLGWKGDGAKARN